MVLSNGVYLEASLDVHRTSQHCFSCNALCAWDSFEKALMNFVFALYLDIYTNLTSKESSLK